MDTALDEVKKKIDIIEYIGQFVTLKKTGRNFKGLCPFHQEKTPSFVVSPDRQIWHCFGSCQDGGDAIKFLMKWENITFYEALKELADKVGVKLRHSSVEDAAWRRKERLIHLNSLAGEYFGYVLAKTKVGELAKRYLSSRKINDRIVNKFQLGYAPQSWDSLFKFLHKKKFLPEEVFSAGLAVQGGRGMYDRFRGRLMFPLKDQRGNVIGFSGRALHDDDPAAKYINTPEGPLYHKRESVYGIDTAKEAIKKTGNVYVVEGEFDVISPYQAGFENIVAVKGTAITREQLQLLQRYTAKITLTMDSDAAGLEAMKKGIAEAEEMELEVGVVSLDFAKDPDEAVQTKPEEFRRVLSHPVPLYDFLIDASLKKYSVHEAYGKKKIGEEVAVFLAKIKNPIVQSHYVKKLAAILDVSESSVASLMRRATEEKKKRIFMRTRTQASTEALRETLLQKYILSITFQDETYESAGYVLQILNPADFSIPAYGKMYAAFLEYKIKYPDKFMPTVFILTLPAELQVVFDEVLLFATSDLIFEKENLKKLIFEAKRYSLKRQLATLLRMTDEKEGYERELKDLNHTLNEVEKHLAAL
ncbi:DNA primase [Candidatus Roizmanbacteria bacterium]|nr:DNA primase [Candidatus Roizmanbacteria bacterium]